MSAPEARTAAERRAYVDGYEAGAQRFAFVSFRRGFTAAEDEIAEIIHFLRENQRKEQNG